MAVGNITTSLRLKFTWISCLLAVRTGSLCGKFDSTVFYCNQYGSVVLSIAMSTVTWVAWTIFDSEHATVAIQWNCFASEEKMWVLCIFVANFSFVIFGQFDMCAWFTACGFTNVYSDCLAIGANRMHWIPSVALNRLASNILVDCWESDCNHFKFNIVWFV